ncbi:hypothetical protein FACS1894122_05230 [Alphaproteobacteria bacterium]|nr:hypothetical protein FACS1894122_05230 [Alphaproteobacteria bacterium]
MRKLLLSCSICSLFFSYVYAEDEVKQEASACEGAKDFEGFSIGVGINIGLQDTLASGNREFKDVPESKYSTTFAGRVAVGYQKAVCGNFLLGIEAGIDMGSRPKPLKVGGELRENSIGFRYLCRQYALSQIINSYYRSFDPYTIPAGDNTPTVDGNVWRNFLKVNRYLGGASNADVPGLINIDGTPGSTISTFINGAYSPLYEENGSNTNATYLSCIEELAAHNISLIGNGSLSTGMKEIRDFIVSNNTDLANTLKSIGEGPIGNGEDNPVGDTAINGQANSIDWWEAGEIALLSGTRANDFERLGITKNSQQTLFCGDIERVNDAMEWARGNMQMDDTGIDANGNVKTKSSFNASPYVALKFGYFFTELNACLYMKAGATQLTGRITPENTSYKLKDDSFRKITPLFAVGYSRNIGNNFAIDIELSKTLKTNKNLSIETPYKYTIDNKVRINKTDVTIMLTYGL